MPRREVMGARAGVRGVSSRQTRGPEGGSGRQERRQSRVRGEGVRGAEGDARASGLSSCVGGGVTP